MDFEGDEAGGEADGKAAADLGGADRGGAVTASGCEADGEARGTGCAAADDTGGSNMLLDLRLDDARTGGSR